MVGATMRVRKTLLAACAVVSLAGCTAEPMPSQWSARPQYYYEPPPDAAPRPAPYYYPPSRPERSAPPADDPVPDQAQIAPPPVIERPSPPALVPADPDCGWWDPCHLWMGS
jgi:hypothetical protein